MFAWEDYLSLARYLEQNAHQTGFPEAAQRSAISRAYYSAYNLIEGWATRYAAKPFIPTRTWEDHSGLRKWLRDNHFTHQAQEIQTLRDWRTQCDYQSELKAQPLSITCVQALRKTEAILRYFGILP